MPYVMLARHKVRGVEYVDPEFDFTNPEYQNDCHALPVMEHEGRTYFGEHTLSGICYCKPGEIIRGEKRIFLHKDTVN